MNRTIKEATVKRYPYDSHARLIARLRAFECICKCWSAESEQFALNPHHQMSGPNT